MQRLFQLGRLHYRKLFVLGVGLVSMPGLYKVVTGFAVQPEPWVAATIIAGWFFYGASLVFWKEANSEA